MTDLETWAAVASAAVFAGLYVRARALNHRLRGRLEAASWDRFRGDEESGSPAWLEGLR